MSGLRDELAALHRPNAAATPRCMADGDVWPCRTAALLDRFPPEAEGEAGGQCGECCPAAPSTDTGEGR